MAKNTLPHRLLTLFGIKSRSGNEPIPISLTDPATFREILDQQNGVNASALRVAAFFACVDRLSKDIATLPVRPMRKTENGQEIASDHDQAFISSEPSPNFTTYTWQYLQNQMLSRFSECFSPIKRKNGRPVEYGFWHPAQVKLHKEGGKKYWENTKTKEIISDDDMVHPMWFTVDGDRGYPITSLMRDTLELGVNGKKMANNQYKNMNWQSGYISYGADLKEEQAEMIAKHWKINVSGEANKDEIAILDNKSEWKNFGGSLKESEVSTIIAFTDEQIARFMGLQPSKIGIRNANVSYNSLEQENISYVQDSLQPRVTSWEQELNRKCIADADQGTIFFKYELKARLRGDIETRKGFYATMLDKGVFTPNNVLRLEDMETGGPECDERYVNAGLVPLSKIFSGEVGPMSAADSQKLFAEYIKSLSKNGNGHAITKSEHVQS